MVNSATAGADGLYRLPLLPIGTYRVTIAATGFGTTVREPVVVAVGQSVRLNVQLELSTVKEAVTVSGGAQTRRHLDERARAASSPDASSSTCR